MRVFKNAWFERFARRERIHDDALCEAIARANRGLVDAVLGGNVIKQRIARPGSGRSGGYWTVIFFRIGQRAVFAFGFAKSDMANIDVQDEATFKAASKLVLGLSEVDIDRLVSARKLLEVHCHDR